MCISGNTTEHSWFNWFCWSIHRHFLFFSPAFLLVSVLVSFVPCPFLSSFVISDLLLWYCHFTLISIRVLWKQCYHLNRQQKLFWLCIHYGDESTVAAEANLLTHSSVLYNMLYWTYTMGGTSCPRPRPHSMWDVGQFVCGKVWERRYGRHDECPGIKKCTHSQPWLHIHKIHRHL